EGEEGLRIALDRIEYWTGNGAQVSPAVARLVKGYAKTSAATACVRLNRVSAMMASGTPPDDLVELGRVAGAYGVQGWIKIEPHAAQSQALLRVREWWLRRDDAPPAGKGSPGGVSPVAPAAAVQVLKSRTQGSTIVAQLAG